MTPLSQITPFDYNDQPVRVVSIDGEPWFVLADLCKILDLSNPTMVAERLDDDALSTAEVIDSMGRRQSARITSEPGMYAVVFMSRKPEAVAFRRWITSEVLPSIRKHGGYLTPDMAEQVLADPDTIIRLATDLKAERAARLRETKAREAIESYAQTLEPKADSYDRFLSGDGTYSIGAVGKMFGLSQQKMFDLLRNSGVLIAKGAMRNTPYQQYMHHFRVTAFSFTRSDGTEGTSYTTRVQPSGVDFIARKLGLSLKAVA